MADLLGPSVKPVSRVLAKLKALEVIALTGIDDVVILDSAMLYSIAKV